jgi:hypothetical protein
MRIRRCGDCKHSEQAFNSEGVPLGERMVCTFPFDLSKAPASIYNRYVSPNDSIATECQHFALAK